MWKRRTFRECAQELKQVSRVFRNSFNSKRKEDYQELLMERSEASVKGIDLLRILSLAVRADQDDGYVPRQGIVVGTIKYAPTATDITNLVNKFDVNYESSMGGQPLSLRDALNTVAHPDSSRTNYFVNEHSHKLILGNDRGSHIAVISIDELCDAVELLPDRQVPKE